ncbi:MAG: NYN domain-containing protein [Candidatus Omnitrophota bacterium]
MPILIDGWNLIRDDKSDISDDDCDSIESATHLIMYLAGFQKRHRDPITVVFDSSRGFLDIEHTNTDTLSLVAVKDADRYIRSYIEKTPERQRPGMRVVSSDKAIYYYVRSLNAAAVTSGEFWDKLRSSRHRA